MQKTCKLENLFYSDALFRVGCTHAVISQRSAFTHVAWPSGDQEELWQNQNVV